MSWEMYQLFYSEVGELKSGPRFRLLADAVAHATRGDGRSYAIRAPDGSWHRDDASGRSVFGGGSMLLPIADGAVTGAVEDEDTQPFGRGSDTHGTHGVNTAEPSPGLYSSYRSSRSKRAGSNADETSEN